MKQHITTEQLNELSDKAKEVLRGWWQPQKGDLYTNSYALDQLPHIVQTHLDECCGGDFCGNRLNLEETIILVKETKSLPLLSIGQMIEFISENEMGRWHIHSGKTQSEWSIESHNLYGDNMEILDHVELADTLWEAVKYILEKQVEVVSLPQQ